MSMYDIDIEVVQHDIGNIAKLQKFTEGSLAKWAIRLGPSFNTNNTFGLIMKAIMSRNIFLIYSSIVLNKIYNILLN